MRCGAKEAVKPRKPREGSPWKVSARAMLAMGREAKPRRRPQGSADMVAPSPTFTYFAPASPQNTRVQLQGPPSTTASRRKARGTPCGPCQLQPVVLPPVVGHRDGGRRRGFVAPCWSGERPSLDAKAHADHPTNSLPRTLRQSLLGGLPLPWWGDRARVAETTMTRCTTNSGGGAVMVAQRRRDHWRGEEPRSSCDVGPRRP